MLAPSLRKDFKISDGTKMRDQFLLARLLGKSKDEIDSAVRKVEGNLEDKDALRAALKEADFASPRGDFTFGNNNYPIQDFYLVKAVKREDGKYATSMVERIFDDYQDNYAAECDMK